MSGLLRLRRARSRALALGPLLLILALLPSLLYIDHWAEHLRLVPSHDEGEAEQVSHSLHCHVSAEGCSEQSLPLTSVDGKPVIVELAEPELTAVALQEQVRQLDDFIAPPLTEPPRA